MPRNEAFDLDATIASEVALEGPLEIRGRIRALSGDTLRALLPGATLQDRVLVERKFSGTPLLPLVAEVIAVDENECVLSALGGENGITTGISTGACVTYAPSRNSFLFGPHLLGCVLDSNGSVVRRRMNPEQSCGSAEARPLTCAPPAALSRTPITTILESGIRAVDTLLTLGHGQRAGIFAEPGVGKSSFLGALARSADVDVVVVALIGERGREVREFVERLGSAGSAGILRTVVVFSTSDEPALSRINAAMLAVTIAEYFRDRGQKILLLVDSLTRLCRAYRDVGLAAGEPAVRRGYPPSVFSKLPRFIERAGNNAFGSITALYTVLLSSELDEDPMVDEIKGLIDGHITLRKSLAERGQYPAVDIGASLSRLANSLIDEEMRSACRRVRRLLSRLEADRDLVIFGGKPDEELAEALRAESAIREFLRQSVDSPMNYDESRQRLLNL